jgi:hypothetical protein
MGSVFGDGTLFGFVEGSAREHNGGDVSARGDISKLLEHVETAMGSREPNVQDDRAQRLCLERGDRLVKRGRFDRPEAVTLQKATQPLPNAFLIIEDEDGEANAP